MWADIPWPSGDLSARTRLGSGWDVGDAGLISRTTTAVLERGDIVPRIDTVERIAYALGMSPCMLAFGLDAPGGAIDELRCVGLPTRMQELRAVRGFSIRQLERQADVASDLVRTTELGRSVPTLATVEKLAKALEGSPGWLAFGLGPMAAVARRPARVATHPKPTEAQSPNPPR